MAAANLYTVIVADDEDELREAVCAMIPWQELGFRLAGSASNGLDALQLVEKHQPDLLLTDIRMPFISGIELARQVREVRPATNIAFLSGYDDFEYAQQAIQYNIISYMLKPLTMEGLGAELRAIREKIDAQYALFRQAARSMSASVRMVRPERISPSGMLGVATVARGSSSPSRVATASSSSSREPAVETITGSTTMFSAWYRRSRWAITSMSLLDETMPIFTASGRMSVKTMSICCPRNSGVASMIPVTPVVFCAVSAVMALMAYTPFMVIVFRSA